MLVSIHIPDPAWDNKEYLLREMIDNLQLIMWTYDSGIVVETKKE
jgi:hypothetical protein